MEHLSKKGFGQLLKRRTPVVDGSVKQDAMDFGTANRLRKLLRRRQSHQPFLKDASQCRIPGHFRNSRDVRDEVAVRCCARPAPSTLHIDERYIRYDVNTTPLIIVLAISVVFFGCLLVLKDIIIQFSQNIVSVAKWKILGASFGGTTHAGLFMGLVGTIFSPLSVVSSWLSFIF
ncbi:YNL046W [Saccharomyces arboricola H-6]|uniref:YNL046W n=1 Tax=Saccharomyces arboricola (strain H-6 / AS 2.3317 / CBS 10644) TaxID=1160507 RepID=J8Q2W5_SACAR|nr:YNL046W [Saccharomyces arboricola H-6]